MIQPNFDGDVNNDAITASGRVAILMIQPSFRWSPLDDATITTAGVATLTKDINSY